VERRADDWHTTAATVDLREAEFFRAWSQRTADGLDFAGHLPTRIMSNKLIELRLAPDRKAEVEFIPAPNAVSFFFPASILSTASRRTPWTAQGGMASLLDNFAPLRRGEAGEAESEARGGAAVWETLE